MRLLTLAVVFGIAALGSKVNTRQTQSLRNRYESNYSATWSAINDLQAGQFTSSQVTFLAGLEPLGSIQNSLPIDPSVGNYWTTNERDYYNNLANAYNQLASALIFRGFAT